MASRTRDGPDDLRDRVSAFLARNFPQIAMHGGDAAIERIDEEAGEVWIRLGGACSGCGISPATIGAIQTRLPKEVPEITAVHADAGFEAGPSFAGGRDGEGYPDAPF